MEKLTTHILDTATGAPAKEVEIKIYKRNDSSQVLIKSAKTNEDGRCNEPLLSGDEFVEGCYEIEFIIEPYIRFKGLAGEQATMFFKDPAGNALEFKSFKDFNQIFEK